MWAQTVAVLAAVSIDVVRAGDGRHGVVLEPGPRGLAVAVRWQPAGQHPLPGGVLAAGACSRNGHPSAPARPTT
ncbi:MULTISPECIES: hypothetical protein [Kitasatospora]|uniref:hypothetical protein n=1 Tax=Kitasatospora TaxID=2063 RepID=UPI0031D63718